MRELKTTPLLITIYTSATVAAYRKRGNGVGGLAGQEVHEKLRLRRTMPLGLTNSSTALWVAPAAKTLTDAHRKTEHFHD